MSKHRIPGVISDNTSNFFEFHRKRQQEESVYEKTATVKTNLQDLISTINSMPICQEKTDMINRLKSIVLDANGKLEA